jgi:hypothetical protein
MAIRPRLAWSDPGDSAAGALSGARHRGDGDRAGNATSGRSRIILLLILN